MTLFCSRQPANHLSHFRFFYDASADPIHNRDQTIAFSSRRNFHPPLKKLSKLGGETAQRALLLLMQYSQAAEGKGDL